MNQPAREKSDGGISVTKMEGGRLRISCDTDGVTTSVVLGAFNAWRAFGMLAMMLEIKLPAKLGKSIKL